MALKIDTISITLMNKGAHSNYMETVLEYLDKYEPVKAKAQTEYSNLSAALETENQYFNVPKKSENTEEIEDSDHLRDVNLRGYETALDYAVATLTDATKLQYAKRLKQHRKEANIDKRAQRDKQTGRMTNFIEDLETKYATEVAALELEVELLRRAVFLAEEAFSRRNGRRRRVGGGGDDPYGIVLDAAGQASDFHAAGLQAFQSKAALHPRPYSAQHLLFLKFPHREPAALILGNRMNAQTELLAPRTSLHGELLSARAGRAGNITCGAEC